MTGAQEVRVDSRRRISLGQLHLGISPGDRFAIERDELGNLRLIPVVSVPVHRHERISEK